MAYLLISLANKTLFGQMSKYSSIYNIWGEIRPITFGNTAWPLDGTCINNDGLICHCWVPFADVTSICQSCFSFANVDPYLPILYLICRCYVLFAKESPHLPIQNLICQFQLSQLPIQLPDLPKALKKIFLTPPNGYHTQKIASARLYSINIDSLFFLFFFYKSSSHPM